MRPELVVLALVGAAIATGVWSGLRSVSRRRGAVRGGAVRDDTLRAGRSPDLDPGQAARRSLGRNAWMGPGSGGS